MSSRSRGRQFAVQMIYQFEFSGDPLDHILHHFWRNIEADQTTRAFSSQLARGVIEERRELDLEINGYLKNWTLDRIATLDRIILELALFELLAKDIEVPWKVVIDEAVTLAKMFGTDKSPTFINGVLHAWCARNSEGFKENPNLEADIPSIAPDTPSQEAETPAAGEEV